MDREVRISDMVAYEMEFGTPAREQFWRTRMNAGDVVGQGDTTNASESVAMSTSQSQTTSGAKDSNASDGGTGSGGGSVADLMRELLEALDSYRRIWPWIESSTGAAHIRLRRAVDAVLAINLTTMEKRAERTEEWYERAIAAEAKVKKLEEQNAELKDDLHEAQQSNMASLRKCSELDAHIDKFEKKVAKLERKLAEEREACESERLLRKAAEAVINAVSGDLELLTDNRITLSWCRGNWKEKRDSYRKAQEEHDNARRDREKQNNGVAPTRQDNGDQQCQPKTHATADTSTNSVGLTTSANTAEPSSTRVSTTNAIVGLEKRAEAAEAKVKELEIVSDSYSRQRHTLAVRLQVACDQIATLTRLLGEERDACDALRGGCGHVLDLINESEGVAGLHRNGDVADWDSLISGNFHEWLSEFDTAVKQHDTRREREKQGEGKCKTNQNHVATADQPKASDSDSASEVRDGSNGCSGVSSTSTASVAEKTTDPPATVTDEDRRVAEEYETWVVYSVNSHEERIERLLTLIARIRHQRDGEIRELVEALRRFMYRTPLQSDYDRGAAVLAKHQDQPCQKTNAMDKSEANAETTSTATTKAPNNATESAKPESGLTRSDRGDAAVNIRDSAPPSEPEAVKSARRMLAGGDVDFGEVTVSGLVTAYDALAKRLHEATLLIALIRSSIRDDAWNHVAMVDAFLAGNGWA